MRVLITGASGFLGTNIVLACLEKGWKVKAFGLPGSNVKYIERPEVEMVFGDVADPDVVRKAMVGVDAAIHTAGDTSFWKRLFERQRRTNVDGVRTVMQACLDCGVKRVVHTSTVDVLGYNPNGLANEDWKDYNYANTGYNYADTKREGERIALSFVKKGLDVIVINPGSMIGPYDHTLQFGRLFKDIRDGKVPAVLPGGAPWAHVEEVARAHITAMEKGRSGERYICGGVNETYKAVFFLIAEAVGVRPPRFTMTSWMTVGYGYLMEFISSFTNTPPDLNPGQARYMSVFPKYDSSKAKAELDFKCIPL
ncbi:MAG: SDR family oxidoreductase, partial [Thermodesulfobacteriota bacterium]|nr:SDR family oxidoreductase [Thermodesulfobacteriota bacterium]